jgi:hypothetical protein
MTPTTTPQLKSSSSERTGRRPVGSRRPGGVGWVIPPAAATDYLRARYRRRPPGSDRRVLPVVYLVCRTCVCQRSSRQSARCKIGRRPEPCVASRCPAPRARVPSRATANHGRAESRRGTRHRPATRTATTTSPPLRFGRTSAGRSAAPIEAVPRGRQLSCLNVGHHSQMISPASSGPNLPKISGGTWPHSGL